MDKKETRERIKFLLFSDDMDIEERMQELIKCIPELEMMYHKDHNQPAHCFDIFTHTLSVVDKMPKDEIGRLCALLHDIGKPLSQTIVDGVTHYWGHPEVSCAIAYKILIRLGYFYEEARIISSICLYHDTMLDKSYEIFLGYLSYIGYRNFHYILELQKADLTSHADWYIEKKIDGLNKSHENIKEYIERAKKEKLIY